jgi:hypothetical protein
MRQHSIAQALDIGQKMLPWRSRRCPAHVKREADVGVSATNGACARGCLGAYEKVNWDVEPGIAIGGPARYASCEKALDLVAGFAS